MRIPKFMIVAAAACLGLGMITLDTVRFDAVMIPVVVLSALFGRWIMGRISPGMFKKMVLVLAGVVDSKSAARRAVAEGGAYLNNQKVTDPEARAKIFSGNAKRLIKGLA